MALSNPKRTIVEAVLETTGFYGFLYQLRVDSDGTLMARAYAQSTDGDAIPFVGVIDMLSGKEPIPGGPIQCGAAGDTVNFVVEGTARAFIHVKARNLVTGQELYIGTSGGGTSNLKLVNDVADTQAGHLSAGVTDLNTTLAYIKYVRAQYIGSADVDHDSVTKVFPAMVRVINNPGSIPA